MTNLLCLMLVMPCSTAVALQAHAALVSPYVHVPAVFLPAETSVSSHPLSYLLLDTLASVTTHFNIVHFMEQQYAV